MKLKINFDFNKLLRQLQEKLVNVDNEKFKAYFYITLSLFSISFFGLVAIGPTLNTISNLNKQYDDNNVIYQALTQKLEDLRLLDIAYQTLEGNVNSIYAAIPKTAKIPYLTRQLENMAADNNLHISKLDVGNVEIFPNAKGDTMYSYIFTVGVVGDRSDVNNFLGDLINFDRIVGIERITTGTDAQKQYNMVFSGRVYFAIK